MSARSQISASQAREMASNPGFYLRPDSAAAWDRAVAAFGKLVLITGALRSYETQVRLFTDRYQVQWIGGGPYGDVRWWKGKRYVRKWGTAAAAVPGTSNHGSGDAVDVKTRRSPGDPGHDTAVVFWSWDDRDRVRFLQVAAEHGWADDEGRRVSELWHLTYYPERDRHRGTSSAGGGRERRPHRIQTVRRGDHGFPVLLVQRRLRGFGTYRGRLDNDYGPKTEAAVAAFQRARGLVVDGVVGPHTWFEMAQGAKFGRGGKWRNKVAQRVVGFKGAAVDGVIGPKSDARIREVQRWLGVKVDGVLGPKTVRALIEKG